MRFRFPQLSSYFIIPLIVAFCSLLGSLSAQEAKEQRILFLGDSITAGYNLEKNQTYPAQISAMAKQQGKTWECVNAGLSGDTTTGGVRRIKVLARKPFDLFVIALGGNDGLRGIQPAATQKNLSSIIDTIKKNQANAKILLIGIEVPDNMGEAYKKSFLSLFTKAAQENKVALYPNLIEGIAGDPTYNQQDVIHPNAKGQKMIASRLLKKIDSLLSNNSAPEGK